MKSAVLDVVLYTSVLLQLLSCSFVFIHSPQETPVRKVWVVSVMRDLWERFPGEMCCITERMLFP